MESELFGMCIRKNHNAKCQIVAMSIFAFEGCTVYMPSYVTRLTHINISELNGKYLPVGSVAAKTTVNVIDSLAVVTLFTEDIQPSFNRRKNCQIIDTLKPMKTSTCSNYSKITDNTKIVSIKYQCTGESTGIGAFKGLFSTLFIGKPGKLSCEVIDTANSLLYIFDLEKPTAH